MLAGKYPFYDNTAAKLFEKIRRAEFTVPPSSTSSLDSRIVIHSLLRRDPASRYVSTYCTMFHNDTLVGQRRSPCSALRGCRRTRSCACEQWRRSRTSAVVCVSKTIKSCPPSESPRVYNIPRARLGLQQFMRALAMHTQFSLTVIIQ